MPVRTFIAVEFEPTAAMLAALDELKRTGADLKMVQPENMHVTLKFIGEVDEGALDGLRGLVRTVAARHGPVGLRVRGMGAFPSMNYVNVVWLGLEGAGPLVEMARELEDGAAALGHGRDRKGFISHLTLARVRSARGIGPLKDLIRSSAAADYGEGSISALRLKSSVLSPGGPAYSDLEVCPLGRPQPP